MTETYLSKVGTLGKLAYQDFFDLPGMKDELCVQVTEPDLITDIRGQGCSLSKISIRLLKKQIIILCSV